MLKLKIGRRATFEVATIAEAQAVYGRERDNSGEGASTFPDGALTVDGRKLRVSYNGRVWAGDACIPG